MPRPRLVDLFCGGGGAARGYHDAGFDVVGVDLVRQPHYPYPFHLGNALTYPLDGFDVVHASPPCKPWTRLQAYHSGELRLFDPHFDFLAPTIERLTEWGGVWVIENVVGAPMPAGSITLCGSSFGLRVRRHRLFASSATISAPPCDHAGQGRPIHVYGNGGGRKASASARGPVAAAALGIDWTDHQPALAQAIPPAYTTHIGRQLLAATTQPVPPAGSST